MNRWSVLACLGAGFALLLNAGSAHSAEKDKEKNQVRVLFVLGSPWWHDIRALAPMLQKSMEEAGLKVTRLEPPMDKKTEDPGHLAKLADVKRSDYDVIVLYTDAYKLGDLPERAVEKFVEEGGGLVALHGTSKSFVDDKAKPPAPSMLWQRLIGARCTGHIPKEHKLNVVIADKDHPVTKGVEPFTITDQEFKHELAEVKRTVLARFKERPADSDQKANMDIIWTREVGKGRVFYNALGHDKRAWENPAWQKLTLQGIYWAAGKPREVKVPADSK